MDLLGRFSAIFSKGDNFPNVLFAFWYTKPLLKWGLSWKKSEMDIPGRKRSKFFSLKEEQHWQGRPTIFTKLPSLQVYPFSFISDQAKEASSSVTKILSTWMLNLGLILDGYLLKVDSASIDKRNHSGVSMFFIFIYL